MLRKEERTSKIDRDVLCNHILEKRYILDARNGETGRERKTKTEEKRGEWKRMRELKTEEDRGR